MNCQRVIQWHGFVTMIYIKSVDFLKIQKSRLLAFCSLLSFACWLFILNGAGFGMDIWAMTSAYFPALDLDTQSKNWTFGYSLKMLFMWWLMMLAMMLPGLILNLTEHANSFAKRGIYVFGKYSLVWLCFSIVAVLGQFIFEKYELVHSLKMWSISPNFSIIILIIVGLYQFTKAKSAALMHCKFMPIGMSLYWQHCLIATAPMTMLLFVGGVMNLYWIFAISISVTIEKILHKPKLFSWALGTVILLLSARVFTQTFLD